MLLACPIFFDLKKKDVKAIYAFLKKKKTNMRLGSLTSLSLINSSNLNNMNKKIQ